MTAREKFAFLDAKRKLLQPIVEATEAYILERTYSQLAEVGVDAVPASGRVQMLREMDRKLERLIVEWVVEEDEKAVRAELKKQFGFSSFGDQPEKALKRILREQKIRNEEEAKLVQDFLAGSYLGWDAAEKKLARFSEILAAYDRWPR